MLLIGLSSCKSDEDFLTEKPATFYTLNNAFSTSDQVDQVLVSCYSQIRKLMTTSNEGRILRGNGTDEMEPPLFRVSTSFSDYSKLTADYSVYNTIYSGYYQLIAKANTAIFVADKEGITWNSEQARKYAMAQAKFFRAYAYRNLGELFGGVPIVNEIITTSKYDFVRATRIETYQFAIDDLESVLNDFPETTIQGGRIVKGAALHYLAELYLALGIEIEEQGKSGDAMYNKAIGYASEVIDGSVYTLMTQRFGTRKNVPKDVFWDLFQKNNIDYQDGNKECIWDYQIDFNAYLAEDVDAFLNYPQYYMPVLRSIPGIIGMAEDVGGRGVAFIAPTRYMTHEVWQGDVGKGDMRNSENNIQRTFLRNDPKHPLFGQPISEEELFYFPSPGASYPIWWKLSTDQFEGLTQGQNRSNIFRDEYAIRLPETILLRAEAYWRKGDNHNAANDINKIRERAQCQYLVTPQDVNLDFILDERARELFAEESRWNTLLRMGGTVAIDRIREAYFWPNLPARQPVSVVFNLWPIPQTVIDRNKDVPMAQNPGW